MSNTVNMILENLSLNEDIKKIQTSNDISYRDKQTINDIITDLINNDPDIRGCIVTYSDYKSVPSNLHANADPKGYEKLDYDDNWDLMKVYPSRSAKTPVFMLGSYSNGVAMYPYGKKGKKIAQEFKKYYDIKTI